MSRSARRQGEDDLREAAFRALIAARTADPAGGRLFFLAIRSAGKDRDPRPLLMTRFLDLVPDGSDPRAVAVLKASRVRRAGGFVVAKGTGRLGTILRLSRIAWDGHSPKATVYAQWFSHPNNAARIRIELERDQSEGWTVLTTSEEPEKHRRKRSSALPPTPGPSAPDSHARLP